MQKAFLGETCGPHLLAVCLRSALRVQFAHLLFNLIYVGRPISGQGSEWWKGLWLAWSLASYCSQVGMRLIFLSSSRVEGDGKV